MLTVLHLPIALWLAVGVAYVGGRWFADGGRMNFVRFSGELAIYYVLIALGGGVVTVFTFMMFRAIEMNPDWFVAGWLIPCGAAGAVIIGSWLVEAKQSVIENMAPVLTRLFTPLFTVLLLGFLATMAWTGSPINVKREVLIGFDLLLAVVVGLVLYAASARDPQAPPDFFDGLQLLLVVSALVVDGVALSAIAARISEFGFTPNRVAALGENLILLVNLTWTAWLYARFLRHRGLVCRPGAMADRLSARVLRMGGARGYRVPASVRLPLMQSIGGIVKHLLLLAALQGALLAQSIEGTWQGTLTPPNQNQGIRLAFKIAKNGNAYEGRFYNLENGRQFNLGAITLQGNAVKIVIPGNGMNYEGKIEVDGNSITGTLTQGTNPLPLPLKRATAETAWELPPPPAAPKGLPAGTKLEFEVASIKPSRADPPANAGFNVTATEMRAPSISLARLITFAYATPPEPGLGAAGLG